MRTEAVDPRFVEIDAWPTETAIEAMLEGQLAAIAAVQPAVPAIAAAADAAALRLRPDGRLVYAGAGTSGRLAVQDGIELGPTYGWPAERLVLMLAGGNDALLHSAEGAEDDAAAAQSAVAAAGLGTRDVLIAVAASGRTPYTLAAVQAARAAGALTIAIANNPDTPLLAAADHALLAATGSEIVAGSTRMKAGTAQKAMLNLLSTAIMLRSGLVYRGLMVRMRVANDKLLDRGRRIVRDVTGVDAACAAQALEAAGRQIAPAILIAAGAPPERATALLRAADDDLGRALAMLERSEASDA
ncbi:MAG: N-acetylmuramic acid 6-phosphate etherase [Proteobacteria bacterium SG_bin6]|nr:MAG: N-acetylmuramic acid 6-phosphate etherase [Proteobacteria bacterium SG_bin6]